MKDLFGTDGIRGTAGEFPLDQQTVSIIGASLARHFRERLGRDPLFVTGRDTRESGAAIESALHTGAMAGGAKCVSAGVITTPGVAYLAQGRDAGIVISASHNPYDDNGIKVFLPSGVKMDESMEKLVEKDIELGGPSFPGATEPIVEPTFRVAYSLHLVRIANQIKRNPLKIVIDCANGAASSYAGKVFKRCCDGGVILINNSPDGRNINENCGSLHLDALREKVVEEHADLGVAFDGDADRALFVDERGEVVDGDATLWVLARQLHDDGKLAGDAVVATVMSNIGLEIALASENIRLIRTSVGDKYVLEKLVETGASIGGEQSGHIIIPEISLVGDGMMTALLLLRSIADRDQSLSEAVQGFVRYPQVLVNVKVREKRPFDEVPAIARASDLVRSDLDGNGRLLLRYSGTENLARVMIEGRDQSAIEDQARHLAGVIEKALG